MQKDFNKIKDRNWNERSNNVIINKKYGSLEKLGIDEDTEQKGISHCC